MTIVELFKANDVSSRRVLLPAGASEQGNVIGLVSAYIYIYSPLLGQHGPLLTTIYLI